MSIAVFTSNVHTVRDRLEEASLRSDTDNARVSFYYKGVLRETKPLGIDDNGNYRGLALNEPDSPFKKFNPYQMHDVSVEYDSITEKDTSDLRRKLDALKIFRPQHVAAADALLSMADEVDTMRSNAPREGSYDAAVALTQAADSLQETISQAIEPLTV